MNNKRSQHNHHCSDIQLKQRLFSVPPASSCQDLVVADHIAHVDRLYCHDASQSLTLDLAETTQECSRDFESSRHPSVELTTDSGCGTSQKITTHRVFCTSKFERVWILWDLVFVIHIVLNDELCFILRWMNTAPPPCGVALPLSCLVVFRLVELLGPPTASPIMLGTGVLWVSTGTHPCGFPSRQDGGGTRAPALHTLDDVLRFRGDVDWRRVILQTVTQRSFRSRSFLGRR